MRPTDVSLDTVIANDELARRPLRSRDRVAEKKAFRALAETLAGSPRQVLQALTDIALQLCRAQSAGISILEHGEGRQFFRWHAVSGQWRSMQWNTLPREFSPCGTVLDRAATQLMISPERYFTPMEQISPKVVEVLLVPFEVAGENVGTVWVIAHDASRRFDGEDHRLVSKLAVFAAAAYERLQSLSAEGVRELTYMRKTGTLPSRSA